MTDAPLKRTPCPWVTESARVIAQTRPALHLILLEGKDTIPLSLLFLPLLSSVMCLMPSSRREVETHDTNTFSSFVVLILQLRIMI